MIRRFIARQFAHPSGLVGRVAIAPWLDRISRKANALVAARLDPAPGDEIVELGFGGGDLLARLLAAGPSRVTGIDRSAEMIGRAGERFAAEVDAGRLRLVHASGESLPLDSDCANKACAIHNIYFWEAPDKVFAELARLLRPKGLLVIGFEPAAHMRKWPGHRHGFGLYEEDEVKTLLRKAGFEVAWTERLGGGFIAIGAILGETR
ncbi:MAG: class I SAM-dependent methyltransferase [Sphingomonadaceae bacterium]